MQNKELVKAQQWQVEQLNHKELRNSISMHLIQIVVVPDINCCAI